MQKQSLNPDASKSKPWRYAAGELVQVNAPGLWANGRRGLVNEHRHVGPPLDVVMVGVTFPDGWSQWFLPEQVGRVP